MQDIQTEDVLPHLFRATLKALILEMAVEEFSSPSGLAHQLLALGKDHSNRETVQSLPSISEITTAPGRRGRPPKTAQADPALLAAAKAEGPKVMATSQAVVPPTQKPEPPVATRGKAWDDSPDALKAAILSYATANGGQFVSSTFSKQHRPKLRNSSMIYRALQALQDDDRIERTAHGRYILVNSSTAPSPAPSAAEAPAGDGVVLPHLPTPFQTSANGKTMPSGFWEDAFKTMSARHENKPWGWVQFRDEFGFDSNMMTRAYAAMNQALKKKVMKRTADGYAPTAATVKDMAAHA